MPKYAKSQREYHISRIRAAMISKPGASLRVIKDTLENSNSAPISLDLVYIGKLRHKILRERTMRHKGESIVTRLATLQDHIVQLNRELWALLEVPLEAKDRIKALAELRENELKLLAAEMDAGLYERKLGTIDIEARRNQPIDASHRQRVIDTFRNWGFIDAEVVVEPEKQNHDQPQPKTQALPPGHSSGDR